MRKGLHSGGEGGGETECVLCTNSARQGGKVAACFTRYGFLGEK